MSTPLTGGPLKALYDILEFGTQLKDVEDDKVWGRIVDKLSVALDCEAATYYSFLAAKKHLLPRYAVGPNAGDLKGTPVDTRTGICGWVATHREPLVIEDVYKDERFLREVDGVTGFKTRNCLCVPIVDRLELTGVIQILNMKATPTAQDLTFTVAVCRLANLALRAMKLEATVDKVTARNASIIENLGGGFIAIDTHGRIILCNPAAKRILNLPSDMPLHLAVDHTLMHVPKVSDILLDTLASRKVVKRQDLRWDFQGEERLLGYSTILIQDPNGELSGAGITFQDLTQLKR
jgi:PAS domain S-box-containing protein